MTERNDPGAAAPPAAGAEPAEERQTISYEGSRVPWLVILIWLAFFVWGLVYLLRWVPESWQEWFSRPTGRTP